MAERGPSEPEILAYIARCQALAPDDAWIGTARHQRVVYDRLCAALRRPRPAGVQVEDLSLGLEGRDLALRLYRPATLTPQPAVLYLHGGGLVVGSLDSHDDVCAELAAACGTAVLAVDYRLAPEHRYPAALEDCLAALADLRARAETLAIDPARILVAGDSAGGTLTAALTLALRDGAGPQVQGQLLIYPMLGGDTRQGSYREHAEGPLCTTASIEGYWRAYQAPGQDQMDPHFKPLLSSNYNRLPDTFITVCEFDPLRDDGLLYAQRLASADVPVMLRREPQMVHGYLHGWTLSPGARAAFEALCAALRHMARDRTGQTF